MKSRIKLAVYTDKTIPRGNRGKELTSPSPCLHNEVCQRVDTAVGLAMAELEHTASKKRYTLYPEFDVGRSHSCSLRLSNRMVSGHHAAFRWSGTGWFLCDLGSSNGTFVGGRKLEPGERAAVTSGFHMAFGDASDLFELVGDGPPEPVARAGHDETIFGEDDVLALPSSADPQVIVRRGAGGHWIADFGDGEQRSLDDGETITVQGRSCQLILPLRWKFTWQPDESPLLIDSIALRFEPSQNRDHVEITIVHGSNSIELPPRAHSRLLLELAAAQLADRTRPGLPVKEHGWLSVNDLLEACDANSPQQLHLQVHRAREQFRRFGVVDAHRLIESRRINGLRRIGVANLEIVSP